MRLEVEFKQQNKKFNTEFGDVRYISDGGYDLGYREGHEQGVTEGEAIGYGKGEAVGYENGYTEGDTAGYNRGYNNGYNKGVEDTTPSGEIELTENKTYDVAKYASAKVAVVSKSKLPSVIDRTVTEITAEDLAGITKIGDYAFSKCTNLVSVSLSNDVTRVGQNAFYGCSKIKKITLSGTAVYFDNLAFSSCNSLLEVHCASLEDWMKMSYNSGNYAHPLSAHNDSTLYIKGEMLTELTITRGLNYYAFRGVNSLTTLTIDYERTGGYAFSQCRNLKNITLTDKVTQISIRCFEGCIAIESIAIPKSVTEIQNYAFSSCNALMVVDLTAFGQVSAFPSVGNSSLSIIKSNGGEIRVPKGRKAELAAMTNWATYGDYIVEV